MCFSASASFTAAGLLAVIGSVTTSKAKKKYRMLASMPFLFAMQQALEGFLWLSFEHTRMMQYQLYFVYGFLFFAFLVWPIWVPLSLYVIEPSQLKKRILFSCLCIGDLVTIGLFLNLYFYGAGASVVDQHIVYQIKPTYPLIGKIFYLMATVVPLFVSSVNFGWLLGVAWSASYVATYYFYYQAFVSVWCFFAALISILLLMIIP